jgi:hypothetical protein
MIVARHEVPGTAPPKKSRPLGYGVIPAGVRTDSMIGVTKTETRRTFRREIPLGSAAPDHTVPYGTVLSRDAFPGTSCLATISLSLRDKSHSLIEGPRIKLALMRLDPQGCLDPSFSLLSFLLGRSV